MTTYVEVSEHNPAKDLLQLVSEKVEIDERDPAYCASVFEKCFCAKDRILAADEQVFSTVFSLQFQMLQLIESHLANELSLKFVDILTEDSTRFPKLKIELLSHLFNLLGDSSPTRSQVFRSILSFAVVTDNCKMLTGRLSYLETWTKLWDLSPHETSQLYLLASQVSEKGLESKTAQEFRIKYLRHFDSADSATLSKSRDEACAAVVSAVRSSDRCDSLLDLKAVAALESSDPDLFALLQIFSSKCVNDFLEWERNNPKCLENHHIDRSKALSKLRMLTICSMGAAKEVLSFESLKRELAIETDDEVERIVVQAVHSGLLEAKIDQRTRSLTVTRTTQRFFDESNWTELKQKLSVWKENTRSTLLGLRQIGQHAVDMDQN